MTRKFGYYVRGAVKLVIQGEYPERFINLCIAEHIALWGVKKLDHFLIAWIAPEDFFRIRPIVRKAHVRVKLAKRYGFPFLFKRLKKRKMLLGGAAFFCVAIYWLSSYIWFVEVVGAKSVPETKIRAVMDAHGLCVGVKQNEIASKNLEKDLLLQVPELAWAGVNFTGTRAVVEVVEKVLPAADGQSEGDLVASKNGVITECILLTGVRATEVGDTVKAGDVLIREGGTGESRAQGIVKAKVVYESYGEAALLQNDYTVSGRRDISIRLRVNEEVFHLRDANLTEFPAYEHEQIVKKLPWWRNQDFTVESIINVYHELNVNAMEISIEEAKYQAQLEALAQSKALIPEDAYVIERSMDVLDSSDPNLIKVKMTIETEEDIGKYIKYNKE